jgi:hypothetical protein
MTVLWILFTFWCLIVGGCTLLAVVIGAACWAAMKLSEYREDRWKDRRIRHLIDTGQPTWGCPTNRQEDRRAR